MRKLDSEKYLLGLQYFSDQGNQEADPAIGIKPAISKISDGSEMVITELTKQIKNLELELAQLKPQALKVSELQTAYNATLSELETTKTAQLKSAKKVSVESGLQKAVQEYNIPLDIMNGIINSYNSEDELLNAFSKDPSASLRANHWDVVKPFFTTETRPLDIGNQNLKVSTEGDNSLDAKAFISRKKGGVFD